MKYSCVHYRASDVYTFLKLRTTRVRDASCPLQSLLSNAQFGFSRSLSPCIFESWERCINAAASCSATIQLEHPHFFEITQHNADAERAVADAESAVEAEPGAAISGVDTSGVYSFRDVWAQCTAVQHE